MKEIVLYGHGGSHNHGCEAIVRSTVKILRDSLKDIKIILYSNNPESDYEFGVSDVIDEIRKVPEPSYISRVSRKIKSIFNISNNDINNSIAKRIVKDMGKVDLAISIGGDNYCYTKEFNYLFYRINELLNKNDVPTIFWGCSIEEKFIDDSMINDLKKYKLITVRETITKENLNQKGISQNVKLVHDTAFKLAVKEPKHQLDLDNVIGINLSPMIIGYENKKSITLNNYKLLVKHILDNTDSNILLVSHVANDIDANKMLYEEFKENHDRIFMVPEMKAEEIKHIISKCKMFIGARTHSTIAAYSTSVPTLVVGYSVKAIGIAKDLFGTDKDFVIPVQSLEKDEDLTNAFKTIYEKRNEIKAKLTDVLGEYKQNIDVLKKTLKSIIKE